MINDTLVMESTTDSEEQIRAGLGLPPVGDPPPTDGGTEDPDGAADPDGDEPPAPDAEVPSAPVAKIPVVEPKTPAKPAVAAKAPEGRTADGKFARPKATQKELDKTAAAARRKSEQESDILRAENAALKRLIEQGVVPVAAPKDGADVARDPDVEKTFTTKREKLGAKPKQEDFTDFDEYETKRDEWLEARGALRAQEELAHQGAASRVDLARQDATRAAQADSAAYEASKTSAAARHADYVEVMTKADADKLQLGANLHKPIVQSGEAGGEVTYYLAKNRAELARLNALDPIHAAVEIGKLAATLMRAPGARETPPPPKKRISAAPDPQGTELGAASSVITDDLEAATSQQEYNRMRNRQIAARGHRR